MSYEFKRTGQKFGALTVIDKSRRGGGTYWWVCWYRCGEKRVVEEERLVNGFISICINCEVEHKMEKPIK